MGNQQITFLRPSGNPLKNVDSNEHPVLSLCQRTGTFASVRQYSGWWQVHYPDGKPYVRIEQDGKDPTYVPMQPAGENTYKMPSEVRSMGPAAGMLRFYAKQGSSFTPLEPPLYVEPGGMSDSEYANLLRRIGELAVAVENVAVAPIERGASEQGDGSSQLKSRLRPARVYLSLFDTVSSQWPLILKHPSTVVHHEPQKVKRRKAMRSPSGARALARFPERRTVRVVLPSESVGTVENEMVAYVLQRILVDQAPPLLAYLEQIEESAERWDVPPGFRDSAPPSAGKIGLEISQLATRVKEAREWAKEALQSALLSEVRPLPPRSLSARMARSKEYGPVHHALRKYREQQVK